MCLSADVSMKCSWSQERDPACRLQDHLADGRALQPSALCGLIALAHHFLRFQEHCNLQQLTSACQAQYTHAYQQGQHPSRALRSGSFCLNEQNTDHCELFSNMHTLSCRQEQLEESRPVCTWAPQRAPWMRPETPGSQMCQPALPPALAAHPAVHAELL